MAPIFKHLTEGKTTKRSHRAVNRSQGAEKSGFYGRVRQLRGEVTEPVLKS